MVAFVSVLIAVLFAAAAWHFERSQRVGLRMSGMLLALAGIALVAFAVVNLLLVEEPVHVLPGTLGALMILVGAWRSHLATVSVERVLVPRRSEHPRGH